MPAIIVDFDQRGKPVYTYCQCLSCGRKALCQGNGLCKDCAFLIAAGFLSKKSKEADRQLKGGQ
jgi:hypothetical protein